jgi:Reverse transcriptase (RNA-dependent DNA polymerase)
LHAHPILTAHLSCLFKAIILHSYVPDDFGVGIIVPLVKDKPGELENVSNYRGIILIPIISKVLEGVLLSQCEECLICADLQFGFRKDLGCQHALFALKASVDFFTTRRGSVYATALYISKAFDIVNHSELMGALTTAGVPSWVVNVINNWYNTLYVAVRWCSSTSQQFKVECGVRQGSMLSLSFFKIFINKLIVALKLNGSGCHTNQRFIGLTT